MVPTGIDPVTIAKRSSITVLVANVSTIETIK